MPTNHGEDQTRDHLGARVDTNKKHALTLYAHKLNGEDPYAQVKLSNVVRGAVDEYIARHWDDLPEEAKDALDKDTLADAGEGARGAIVE